jgi:hypothetical protein
VPFYVQKYIDTAEIVRDGRKTGFPPTSLANWQLDDLPTIRPSALRSMLHERIGDYASNEPTAGHGFAAIDQLTPIAVDLFLGVAADEKREGGGKLMRGASVTKDHLLAFKLDRDAPGLRIGRCVRVVGP